MPESTRTSGADSPTPRGPVTRLNTRSPRRVAVLLLLLALLPLMILLSLSIEALTARLTLSEAAVASRTGELLSSAATACDRAISTQLDRLAARELRPEDTTRFQLEPDGRTLRFPRSGYWAAPRTAPLPDVFVRQLEWGTRLETPAAQLRVWDELLEDLPSPREVAILRFRKAVSLMQMKRPAEARTVLEGLLEQAPAVRDGAGIPVGLLAYLYLARLHQQAGEPFRTARTLTALEAHLAARAWGLPSWQRAFYDGQVAERLARAREDITNPEERAYLARRHAASLGLAARIAWAHALIGEGLASGPAWRPRVDPARAGSRVYHRRRPDGVTDLCRLPEQTLRTWLAPVLEQQGARGRAQFRLDPPPTMRHAPLGRMLPGVLLGVDPWGLEAAREDARRRVWLHAASIALALVMFAVAGVTGYRFLCREVEAARSKEAFLASISHELKTPLTSIRIFAESMADGGVPEQKVRQYARRIDREAQRLARLIEGVLDLAAIERGQVRLSLDPLPAEEVAGEALLSFEHRAAASRCAVEIEPGAAEHGVVADRDALVQTLLILLDNAAKYSPEGATVRIGAEAAPHGRVCLHVTDEGPGIPPGERQRVTERFYRGEAAGATPGLGLGLAIADSLVRAMGGQLVIAAGPGGAGTRIRLLLPASPLETAAHP